MVTLVFWGLMAYLAVMLSGVILALILGAVLAPSKKIKFEDVFLGTFEGIKSAFVVCFILFIPLIFLFKSDMEGLVWVEAIVGAATYLAVFVNSIRPSQTPN